MAFRPSRGPASASCRAWYSSAQVGGLRAVLRLRGQQQQAERSTHRSPRVSHFCMSSLHCCSLLPAPQGAVQQGGRGGEHHRPPSRTALSREAQEAGAARVQRHDARVVARDGAVQPQDLCREARAEGGREVGNKAGVLARSRAGMAAAGLPVRRSKARRAGPVPAGAARAPRGPAAHASSSAAAPRSAAQHSAAQHPGVQHSAAPSCRSFTPSVSRPM